MEKITYHGKKGYFMTEEDYQSMMHSYNVLESLLLKAEVVLDE